MKRVASLWAVALAVVLCLQTIVLAHDRNSVFTPRSDSPTAVKLSGKTLDQFRAEGYTRSYTTTGDEVLNWIQGYKPGVGVFYDRHGHRVCAGSEALMRDATHGVFINCLNPFEFRAPVLSPPPPSDLEGTPEPPPQPRAPREPEELQPPPQARSEATSTATATTTTEPKRGMSTWAKIGIVAGIVGGGYLLYRAGSNRSRNTAIASNKVVIKNRTIRRIIQTPAPAKSNPGSVIIPPP